VIIINGLFQDVREHSAEMALCTLALKNVMAGILEGNHASLGNQGIKDCLISYSKKY